GRIRSPSNSSVHSARFQNLTSCREAGSGAGGSGRTTPTGARNSRRTWSQTCPQPERRMSNQQYIFVMKDLRKVVPPNREVLKGIWLQFLPGAKIGVVGPNGAGKSTLLRIMAGVDRDF